MTAVLAHRGYTDGVAENTLEAFAEARRLGADGVELDVRRSADGALVVHHDPVIPGVGPVAEARVRDLPKHVPLLAEALDACPGLLVNVEIKNDPEEPGYDPEQWIARAVADLAARPDWADRILVSSFTSATLDAVLEANGGLDVGWLLTVATDVAGAVDRAADAGYRAVHPFVARTDAQVVDRAHAAGLRVNVWTVNHPDDLRKMVAIGADAVITDRLEDALAIARPR